MKQLKNLQQTESDSKAIFDFQEDQFHLTSAYFNEQNNSYIQLSKQKNKKNSKALKFEASFKEFYY